MDPSVSRLDTSADLAQSGAGVIAELFFRQDTAAYLRGQREAGLQGGKQGSQAVLRSFL